MTLGGFLVWSVFFAFCLLIVLIAEGLCLAAGRPTPSPFDDGLNLCVLEGSKGTPCENCPDYDACEDDACPHDWMDWGL